VLHDGGGKVVHTSTPVVTESLRYLLARLRLGVGGDLPRRIGITSSVSGEGVTFISRSLGVVLANDSAKSVCVVDLNWHSPSSTWTEPDHAGVAQVLDGTATLGQALV